MNQAVNNSRRAFLRGRIASVAPSESPAAPAIVHFGDGCMSLQGVVCRTCGDVCEFSAIRFPPRLGGTARPELDAARCTACGECVGTCPTSAITLQAATGVSAATSQPHLQEFA